MVQEIILLTGATGNVGAVTLEHLLDAGHTVNIVIRRESVIPFFETKFSPAVASGKLCFTHIPDMTVPGVFDEAAASVTAIIHVATPLGPTNLLENLIRPTWTIDANILSAAGKSSTIKRIIVCGTILQAMRAPEDLANTTPTISDKSYNSVPFEIAQNSWVLAYQYAKTKAERNMWAWMEENRKEIGFDVVMLLVPSVTGRSPQVGFKPAEASGGIGEVYKRLWKGGDVDEMFPFFLDTDDVARIHVLSLDRTKVPGNERYLLAAHEIHDLRAVGLKLRAEHPELASRIPELQERPQKTADTFAKLDLSKTDRVFGKDWKSAYESVERTVFDIVKWEEENGGGSN
ncbi:hypothetical protein BDV95DRAFT_605065 [Massariosphaeria phaeospora]|uniref:NAD-dependent epimerase/dehydratase domain-containing protein n=1 Tax=Massariosphaeria phaeospora TaxID=100035 RepID=A0A7C8ICB3_9PLEO|nr:hypothetical protein BDV95DRAFT_605065 [Massariosphaeria phaeospora]